MGKIGFVQQAHLLFYLPYGVIHLSRYTATNKAIIQPEINMRKATIKEVCILINLMSEFYAESGYNLDETHAKKAFTSLLNDERFGFIYLIENSSNVVGYVVVTLRFGMEYGGIIACLDELFVKPKSRNQGLSTEALMNVKNICSLKKIRAITVEASPDNGPAKTVYHRIGMREQLGRHILAVDLAKPTHVV